MPESKSEFIHNDYSQYDLLIKKAENTGTWMESLIKKISPLQRMITSDGLDKAFKILKREIPEIVIHEFSPGSICEDWEVPKAWKVREAFLKDSKERIITSFKDNPLFVAAYSEPIEGWFPKEEIAKHVRCHPKRPDAYLLEHRNAYNYQLVDWGITMPQSLWDTLSPNEEYFIKIEVEWSDETMKVAEFFIPGQSEQIISFSAHIDELCNDDLSGCAVALNVYRLLKKMNKTKYSYQFILFPEAIGTFFYVKNNLGKVRNTLGMVNLETLGAGEQLLVKKSFTKGSYIESLLILAVQDSHLPFRVIDFFDGYGNDERVYEWPSISIPSIALQRFPFAEYHSSDDTPDIINNIFLIDAAKICLKLVQILENDYIPEYKTIIPPWLTKHGLYYDSKDNADKFQRFNNLTLYNINGKNKLSDIAMIAGVSFSEIYDYIDSFIKKDFVKRLNIKI